MTDGHTETGPSSRPFVCVLVLNWNGQKHLEYSLPSILATDYPRWELVVIDNASSDDSVEYVRGFSDVTVLKNARNLQYAAGNNVGFRYALEKGADYVAVLNNDVKVDSRWLAAAVAVAEERDDVGCVGFRVFNEYKQDDPDGSLFEASVRERETVEVSPTPQISGCAIVIRSETLRRIGLFDERYVAYGEEDDLEKRAVKAGYELVRVNVPVWHHSMGTWGRMPFRASWLAMRNGIRCGVKNDTATAVWRHLLSTARSARISSSRVDPRYYLRRRLSPSHGIVNLCLLACAVLWNILFLPQTLAARRSQRKIAAGDAPHK